MSTTSVKHRTHTFMKIIHRYFGFGHLDFWNLWSNFNTGHWALKAVWSIQIVLFYSWPHHPLSWIWVHISLYLGVHLAAQLLKILIVFQFKIIRMQMNVEIFTSLWDQLPLHSPFHTRPRLFNDIHVFIYLAIRMMLLGIPSFF